MELQCQESQRLINTVGIVTMTNSVVSESRKRSLTFAMLSLKCSSLSVYRNTQTLAKLVL